jgi:hypothetical protein
MTKGLLIQFVGEILGGGCFLEVSRVALLASYNALLPKIPARLALVTCAVHTPMEDAVGPQWELLLRLLSAARNRASQVSRRSVVEVVRSFQRLLVGAMKWMGTVQQLL